MNKERLIELIYRALPNNATITNLDLDGRSNAVLLTWGSERLMVTTDLVVECLLDGGLATTTPVTDLIEALLKRVQAQETAA